MDEQTLENIEQASQKLAKAVEAPENQETTEEFIELFKGLGKEGTKEFAKGLDDVELACLSDILTKALSFDKQAVKQPPAIKQPVSESVASTRNADEEDEEMVVSAAAAHNHQGDNSPEKFEGQIIKSDDAQYIRLGEENVLVEDIQKGLKLLKAQKEPVKEDLSKKMPEMDEEGKKKAKKDASKPYAGNAKDGLKGADSEKAKAEGAQAQGEQISKADSALPMDDAKATADAKDLPLASAGKKDSKKAKDQKPESGDPKEGSKSSKDQKPSAEGAKAGFKKSVPWGSAQDARLLKAGGRGQNAHYNASYEILKEEQRRQTIEKSQSEEGARWEPTKEVLQKSESAQQDVGINDIIEKGLDRSTDDLTRQASNAVEPIAKSAPLSFEERELAKSLGMSEEDTNAILGRKE